MGQLSGTRALVIGGGLGGLAAAVGLRRAGVDIAVFERAAELREIGAGVQLWTNGVRALRHLGIGAVDVTPGEPIETFQFRSMRGKVLLQVPLGDYGRRYGSPTVLLRRAELQAQLAAALGDDAIQLGAQCVEFAQDATGVTARFADGREERGDVLIGADGIRSAIRAQQFPAIRPKFQGYEYLRAVVPFAHPAFPPGMFTMVWGPGARFGLAHIGRGQVYWFAILNAREGQADGPRGRKAELIARYRGWAEPVEAIIAATPEGAIGRTGIYDLDPLERWGAGRMTLLGDAAHAITPNLGRGAGEALEDAVALARCFGEAADPVAALRLYETRRAGATASVAKIARLIGALGRWRNPPSVAVRELLITRVLSRTIPRAMAADYARHAEAA
jgi:2-polyprenyl-6-methoxyphenol hydroxylase-like FAD-dependent oxidoreductase